jgi:hypothetical protein
MTIDPLSIIQQHASLSAVTDVADLARLREREHAAMAARIDALETQVANLVGKERAKGVSGLPSGLDKLSGIVDTDEDVQPAPVKRKPSVGWHKKG